MAFWVDKGDFFYLLCAVACLGKIDIQLRVAVTDMEKEFQKLHVDIRKLLHI